MFLLCSITPFLKIVSFWDNVETCGRTRHPSHNNIIGSKRFACWLDRLEIHTQNMNNLLLFHVKNIYTTAPQCYSNTYIVCLVLCLLWKSCCWSTLTIKFPQAMYNANIFNRICFYQTYSISYILYNTKASKEKHLLSDLLVCVALRPMSISFYRYRMPCIATVYVYIECLLGGRECREMYWRGKPGRRRGDGRKWEIINSHSLINSTS